MKLFEINGTYGSHNTQTTVFVAEKNGGYYYVCEGGQTVNFTYDDLEDGVNVEHLNDVDCFTWSSSITSLEMLEHAIEN